VASVYHLVGERVAAVSGVKLVHVPYKGCSEALADVVSGNVDLYVNALPNVLPYMKHGDLVALAVTDAERSALAPDVPTFSEATGIPNVVNQGWYSLMGPAGLPKDIVAKLNGLVTAALLQPDIQANLKTQLYDGKGGPPQVLTDLLTSDVKIWSQLIKDNHIKVQ
jgi:tripartite-type tricarboxylate transporter receptor subunit TctC